MYYVLTFTILLIILNSEAVFYYKAKNRFEKTPAFAVYLSGLCANTGITTISNPDDHLVPH